MLNKKGITFLEVLLTISIAAVISAMGFASFQQWRIGVSLTNDVDELKSKLIEVRQLAVSAADETNWGVHFTEEGYIIFSGDSYNELDPNNRLINLKKTMILNPTSTLSDGIGGFSPNLIFTKFTGQTSNTGTIELIYENDPSISKIINIDDLGKIN